jgi:hypothetical protein
MKEERSGTATEITVTRRDGAIVVETPDAVIVQMPVTINQHAETNRH